MNEKSVSLAAQADLVLLSAEMLRPPIAISAQSHSILRGNPEGKPAWTRLGASDWHDLLRVAELSKSDSEEGLGLAVALQEVFNCVEGLELDAWSDEYWRLFDSSLACPINQAAYIRRDKGVILGDLAGFYRAFGWRHANATGERPDHLLTQLEFVAALLAMTACAEHDEQREIGRDALGKFARVHMHDWLPSFCLQLCEATCLQYYGAVSQWLALLWESLTATHSWPHDQLPNLLAPERDVENPYECAAVDVVQIGGPQN